MRFQGRGSCERLFLAGAVGDFKNGRVELCTVYKGL
jgi:hypothetical protein